MKTKACPYNFIFNMLIFLGVSATAFAAVDGDVEVKKHTINNLVLTKILSSNLATDMAK